MSRQFFLGKTFLEESSRHKIGWTQQTISELIFFVLNAQCVRVEIVLVPSRHPDAKLLAFLCHNLVCKLCVRVWPFQHSRNAQLRGGFQSLPGAKWPCMDDINFAREPSDAPRHNQIMQPARSDRAK